MLVPHCSHAMQIAVWQVRSDHILSQTPKEMSNKMTPAGHIFGQLQQALQPEAPFWRLHNYFSPETPFFSFLLDLVRCLTLVLLVEVQFTAVVCHAG